MRCQLWTVQSYSQVVCEIKDPADFIPKLSCELRRTEICKNFFSQFNPDFQQKFGLTCPDVDEGSVFKTTTICSGLTLATGIATWQSLSQNTKTAIGKNVPTLIKKFGTKLLPYLSVFGSAVSVYSVTNVVRESLEQDRKCYEDIERKRTAVEFMETTTQYILDKTKGMIEEFQERQLKLASQYKDPKFIENLTCQQLNEIVSIQKKKQDEILGKLLASGKLKTDPRKDLLASPENMNDAKFLLENSSCLSATKRIELICAVGNVALGGVALKGFLKQVETFKAPTLIEGKSFAEMNSLPGGGSRFKGENHSYNPHVKLIGQENVRQRATEEKWDQLEQQSRSKMYGIDPTFDMEKVKVGDTVPLLNSSETGRVTEIVSGNLAVIRTRAGREIYVPFGSKWRGAQLTHQTVVDVTLPNGENHSIRVVTGLYKKGYTGTISEFDAIKKFIGALPANDVDKIKLIRINPGEHFNDPYWRGRYKDFDKSGATGGRGEIDFYDIQNGRDVHEMLGTFRHEFAHNLASLNHGSMTPPGWKSLMKTEPKFVSDYAKNSPSEDFAESVRYYLAFGHTAAARSDFPQKMAYLDDYFRAQPALQQKLTESYQQTLSKNDIIFIKTATGAAIAYGVYETMLGGKKAK